MAASVFGCRGQRHRGDSQALAFRFFRQLPYISVNTDLCKRALPLAQAGYVNR